MSEGNVGDDLEKQITLMEQELLFKRNLLDECREKLSLEISEHGRTKLALNKYFNENKELQVQLNVCLTGTQKLEEENKKNREFLVKLQVQFNAYTKERQQLLDNCYKAEAYISHLNNLRNTTSVIVTHFQKENNKLKTEVAELKEQLKGHLMFIENYQKRKTKTEALVSQIIQKQEILNKEQARLENTCKEGLRFAEKLSEEAKYQIKYVREAKISQAKTQEEIVRLMAAVSELKAEKEKSNNGKLERENQNYLEMWKSNQREMAARNEDLQAVNKRLQEELNFVKERLEILMKKC